MQISLVLDMIKACHIFNHIFSYCYFFYVYFSLNVRNSEPNTIGSSVRVKTFFLNPYSSRNCIWWSYKQRDKQIHTLISSPFTSSSNLLQDVLPQSLLLQVFGGPRDKQIHTLFYSPFTSCTISKWPLELQPKVSSTCRHTSSS